MKDKEHIMNITSSHIDTFKDLFYADNTNFIMENPIDLDLTNQTELSRRGLTRSKCLSFGII